MRGLLSVVGALSALQLVSVIAQDTSACLAPCAAQVRAEFTKFGCANAEDRACLCPKADFHNGMRDCAQSTCGANIDNVNTFLSGDYCLGFSPPADAPSSAPAAPESSAPPSSSAPPAPTSSTAPPETTSRAPETSSQASDSTSAPPTTTSQPAESSVPAGTSSTDAPASTTAEPATTDVQSTSTTSSISSSSTSLSSSSSSTSTSAPTDGATKDESEKEDDTEAAAGLTAAAKAGIAVGVIAAVIVGAALAWFLLRKRKLQPSRPAEISKPIPGSRGGYGNSDDQYEKYGDIEMTTRYEDMLPRQQPRTMV